MEDFNYTLSEILGTIFYTAVVFGLGALSGRKIWYWVRTFFPWNKRTDHDAGGAAGGSFSI